MSFDKPTRNALASMVGDCRRLLTDDIRDQLQGVYGLQPDGTALPVAGLTHLDERAHEVARALREWQEHLASTEAGTDTEKKKKAFDRLAHETAFTVLNRLAALRMCEEREHVIECVRRGMESDGFVLYERFSGGAVGARSETYRIFLERMFDELAVDLGALFDLRAPQSLVFPREPCLEKVLTLLNDPKLAHLWKEDETIGWIYQYFNSKEEREKMREESAAPRNSRELAVRNQFFTPRFVVEFLVDNTLGRIWYEMRKGETALKDLCRYLVRRPSEIFLKQGEDLPASPEPQENLSQEELLRQPVCIPHRSKKDPRDLKILDPACGSAHFLLYCFDLLETIYEEAWADEQSGTSEATGESLREDFPELASLKKALPDMILRHNLHGIDIDLRACQIAALALWLRAQRSYQQLGPKGAGRPKITRSNIVCAEPMPGEQAFLEQFLAGLEPRVIGQLVRVVFEKMKLAGEAGSLLKIEEEIAGAVAEAKKQWLAGPKAEQGRLFAEDKRPEQKELGLDLSGITEETFWEKAEERIYAALKAYAEQAENGRGYQRRLFADDAARGFALIDLCRKHYDVALMNPPFGEMSKESKDYIGVAYKRTRNDLYAAFVERCLGRLSVEGAMGAITSRSGFFLGSFDSWRKELLLNEATPDVFADLGEGVLDSAMVETAAYCLHRRKRSNAMFFRLLTNKEKDAGLQEGIGAVASGNPSNAAVFSVNPLSFQQVPGAPFAYWVPESVLALFQKLPALENSQRRVALGLSTKNDVRFVRTHWEVNPVWIRRNKRWSNYANGSNAVPFYWDHSTVVLSEGEFAELRTYLLAKFPYLNGNASWILHEENDYQSPVIGWPLRSLRFSPQAIPPGFVFSARTYALVSQKPDELVALLAFLSSKLVHYLLSLKLGASGRPEYVTATVRELPIPREDFGNLPQLAAHASALFRLYQRISAADETTKLFVMRGLLATEPSGPRLAELHDQVEGAVFDLYGLGTEDRELIRSQTGSLDFNLGDSAEEGGDQELAEEDDSRRLNSFLIYALGCAFGRWDIRFATCEKPVPDLPDPFAPLPVCPPGMLQNEQGLPLTQDDGRRLQAAGQWHYPLNIPWDGILVDDYGLNGTQPHRDDIVRRIRQVLTVIWKDRAEAIEQETCEILEVKELREYFRKPGLFFADHLKRYSKSRRQAPIYWPLSTASGSYMLWVYYHRLNDDTLFTALNKYVKPKIDEVERQLRHIESALPTATGREASKLRDAFEDTKVFLEELQEFRDELQRVAGLPFKPNLNDGVLITASPLWKLFRLPKWRKDLEACWKELEAGKYDWAHLAYTIWPDRVREVCKHDRSIAIAHGLEELCEVAVKPTKKKRSRKQRVEESVLGDDE